MKKFDANKFENVAADGKLYETMDDDSIKEKNLEEQALERSPNNVC